MKTPEEFAKELRNTLGSKQADLVKSRDKEIRNQALEEAADVAMKYWKEGGNMYARQSGRAVERRIRALKEKE